MRVAPILVDAKGMSRLRQPDARSRDLLIMVAAAVIALVCFYFASDGFQVLARGYLLTLR